MPTTNEHIAPTHATRDTETPPRLPSISIIIPVYNVAPYVEECIRSVMAQTYTGPMECLIVDDCGQDDSIAICERLIEEYDGPIDFKILHHEKNKGLSGARNTGIRVAKGDYLYFLDSDDYITADCIDVLAALAVKYKGVDIVQGNIILHTPQVRFLSIDDRQFPEYANNRHWLRHSLLCKTPMTSWNKLLHRDLILANDLLFMEGIIHEDEHWRLMSFSLINSVAYCFTPTYYYRMRPCSIMGSSTQERHDVAFVDFTTNLLDNHKLVWTRDSASFVLYSVMKVDAQDLTPHVKEKVAALYDCIIGSPDTPARIRLLMRTMLSAEHHGSRIFNYALKLCYLWDNIYMKFFCKPQR